VALAPDSIWIKQCCFRHGPQYVCKRHLNAPRCVPAVFRPPISQPFAGRPPDPKQPAPGSARGGIYQLFGSLQFSQFGPLPSARFKANRRRPRAARAPAAPRGVSLLRSRHYLVTIGRDPGPGRIIVVTSWVNRPVKECGAPGPNVSSDQKNRKNGLRLTWKYCLAERQTNDGALSPVHRTAPRRYPLYLGPSDTSALHR
jgi:hypothetical protein